MTRKKLPIRDVTEGENDGKGFALPKKRGFWPVLGSGYPHIRKDQLLYPQTVFSDGEKNFLISSFLL